MKKNSPFQDSWFRHTLAFSLIFFSLLLFKLYYSQIIQLPFLSNLGLSSTYPEFISKDDIEFNKLFIQLAGIVFGFSAPLILVENIDSFKKFENNFAAEELSINNFINWVNLLPNRYNKDKKEILFLVIKYAKHVRDNWQNEKAGSKIDLHGDEILKNILNKISLLDTKKSLLNNNVINQIYNHINTVIEKRNERMVSYNTNESNILKYITVFAAYLFLIPMYFLQYQSGFYGLLLIFFFTFLIIFILNGVEEGVEPYYRQWHISMGNWKDLEKRLKAELKNIK